MLSPENEEATITEAISQDKMGLVERLRKIGAPETGEHSVERHDGRGRHGYHRVANRRA